MRNQMAFSQDHYGAPGPRGLLLEMSVTDRRFGVINYGESADKQAAGVWGDHIPLAVIPEQADKLGKDSARLPLAVEVDGQPGRLDQPGVGFLRFKSFWSRRARAVHVDLPGRHYEYFRRWFHMRVERDGAGEVVRSGGGVATFRITDQADAIDAAVGLLTARVIRDSYVSIVGIAG